MWDLLIFRDHWQGEFCVALFAGCGWAIISLTTGTTFEQVQYGLVRAMLPEWVWMVCMMLFAFMQLYGLFSLRHNAILFRAIGAVGLATAFLSILLGLLFGPGPILPGVATYAACAAIEFCAVILQTAVVIRGDERDHRLWITKPSG